MLHDYEKLFRDHMTAVHSDDDGGMPADAAETMHRVARAPNQLRRAAGEHAALIGRVCSDNLLRTRALDTLAQVHDISALEVIANAACIVAFDDDGAPRDIANVSAIDVDDDEVLDHVATQLGVEEGKGNANPDPIDPANAQKTTHSDTNAERTAAFTALTNKELKALCKQHGIDARKLTNKSLLVGALVPSEAPTPEVAATS